MSMKNGLITGVAPAPEQKAAAMFQVHGMFIKIDEAYVLPGQIVGVSPTGTMSPFGPGGQPAMVKAPNKCTIILNGGAQITLDISPEQALGPLSAAIAKAVSAVA